MRKVLFLFGQLDDADIGWLARAGEVRAFGDGAILIRQGCPADAVFVVLEGEFAVDVAGVGRVATVGAGEVLGEMSFVDSRPPSASVAARDRAVVLAVPRARLAERLGSDAPFAARFYRAMALFLSDRLRALEAPPGDADAPPAELETLVLEQVTAAGLRFESLLQALVHVDAAAP